MKNFSYILVLASLILYTQCLSNQNQSILTEVDKENIRNSIQKNIDKGLEATRNKNIEAYMSC